MTMKRMIAGALTSAALASAAFAAPAPADTSLEASGSQTVPIGNVGGCYRSVTVWWNTSYYPYAGTSGRITC